MTNAGATSSPSPKSTSQSSVAGSQAKTSPAQPWVLLRGLGRDARHWGDLPERLRAAVAQGDCARVLTPDLAGNGSRAHEISPDTIEQATEDYRRQLHSQGFSPPYRLIGLSLGGMVAIDWLTRYPEEITQGYVINSSVGTINRPWLRMRPSAVLRLLITPTRFVRARERKICQLTTQMQPDRNQLAQQWYEWALVARPTADNLKRQTRAALSFHPKRPQAAERLHIMAGAKDRLVNPSASRQLAEAWQLTFSEHPHAGHDLPLDDPQWLIEQIL